MDPSWLQKVEPINKGALQRLEAVFGIEPSVLDQGQLEQRAFEVFCDTDPQTYAALLKEKGHTIDGPGDYPTDGTILFYILEKLFGKKFTGKDLERYITEKNKAVGYFAQEVVSPFLYGFQESRNIQYLWNDYHGLQQGVSKKNADHTSSDEALRKSHTIPPAVGRLCVRWQLASKAFWRTRIVCVTA